jgi:subtilisin family serine protease
MFSIAATLRETFQLPRQGQASKRGIMIRRPSLLLGALILLALPASAAAAPPDSYIVVLKDHVSKPGDVAREHSRQHAADVDFVYEHALRGYAARIEGHRVDAVRRDSRVAYVERDGDVHAVETQLNATWGLDRSDQRALPLSGTFSYTNTGSGVNAYIIDTGIRYSHTDFGGRAVRGTDTVTSGGDASDCNGHGTHVAGTTGGATWGAAKAVTLVAVRVLNCSGSGTWSGVIAGIDWVTADHAAGEAAVANMSLGGGASSSVDTAVKNSIADGVVYAIAAGNGNMGGVAQDACKYSPARVPEAMTISATDKTDTKARWANYGNCVDWFAPGVGITSAWYSSDTATNTISGTSMSTPHTAGVAAQYLQTNSGASPQQVRDALYANATKGVVKSSKTANSHLLFTDW